MAGESLPPTSITASRGEVKSLQLGVGRSMIVELPEDAQEIFVGDPKIANAIVRSARRIYITTLAAGQTTVFALGRERPQDRGVRDHGRARRRRTARLLEAAIPDNDIHVRTVGGSIILTGLGRLGRRRAAGARHRPGLRRRPQHRRRPRPAAAPPATASPAGKVVNSLMIRGLDQVSLRVTISEIRRDVLKQLGVSYSGLGPNASGGFGSGVPSVNVHNPMASTAPQQQRHHRLDRWPARSSPPPSTPSSSQGVAHTLAEPTVTAISGERAKFLAGGTIPIPSSESCLGGGCTLGYIQQPYGVTLNFTPVVLSQGRIQLRVATEVTDIDYSKSIKIAETNIPGFRTRRNETTVELPSGGSIVSAGLLSTQSNQAITGLPGLMNLPVLGALFRSRDYQRQETELLIIVTPYIVHAVDPKDVVRPDQNFAEASDPQSWLLGRVNRIYSSSGGLRPMPNYTGKVGFITD